MNNINQDLERACVAKQSRGEQPSIRLSFPFTVEQVSPTEVKVHTVAQNLPVVTKQAFDYLSQQLGEKVAHEIADKLDDEFNRLLIINSITIIK